MELEEYRAKKNTLENLLQNLANLSEETQQKNLARSLREDVVNLNNEGFSLLVVGEFSSGKSTAINAMLGHKILRATSQPTTAVISKIVYGETPAYIVHNKDGKVKEISAEEYATKVAPKESRYENDRKGLQNYMTELAKIDYVEIHYPLDFCKNQVDIVDTPGVNDISQERMEITYNYLRKADAIIMLLKADQLFSASEFGFLKEHVFSQQIRDIFFLINRKDVLTKEEEPRVVQHAKEKIAERLADASIEVKVHLVSALQALIWRELEHGEALSPKKMLKRPQSLEVTGYPQFEQDLGHFLSVEKGTIKLRKYIRRAEVISMQLLEDTQKRLVLAACSTEEIRAQAKIMKRELKRAREGVERIVKVMRRNFQAGETEIENICLMQKETFLQGVAKAMNHAEAEEKAIRNAAEYAFNEHGKILINKITAKQREIQNETLEEAARGMHRIWEDMELAQLGKNVSIDKENGTEWLPATTGNTKMMSKTRAQIGLFAGAFAIADFMSGGLISGVLFFSGIAAWAFGLFDGEQPDPLIKYQHEIRKATQKRYDAMYKSILKSYKKAAEEEAIRVQEFADERLEDMETQFKAILEERESQEQSREKTEHALHARIEVITALRQKIQVLEGRG